MLAAYGLSVGRVKRRISGRRNRMRGTMDRGMQALYLSAGFGDFVRVTRRSGWAREIGRVLRGELDCWGL